MEIKTVNWPDEIEHSLERLHRSSMRLTAKLRIAASLTHKLQEAGDCVPGFAAYRDLELEEYLGAIERLLAETVHEIELNDFDVIDKILQDFADSRVRQAEPLN